MVHGRHNSPIALAREGPNYSDVYRVFFAGVVTDVSASDFNRAHHIDGVIRVTNDMYANLDDLTKRLTIFNLEFSGHRIGAVYALPRIVRHGYFRSPDAENPPTLSFEDIALARCVSVSEFVPYRALSLMDFRYAESGIQDVPTLKHVMTTRYGTSLPGLSKNEILERGVSVTTLRLLAKHKHLDI